MFTTRFSGMPFAPGHLRPLLRERMVRGERLMGWAVAEIIPPATAQAMQIALNMLPLIGPLFTIAAGMKSRDLLVLTDVRLLMVRPHIRFTREPGLLVHREHTLDQVRVTRLEPEGLFELRFDTRDTSRVQIKPQDGRGAGRLSAALTTLAEG